ncbi:MAG: hydroxyacid dehydrogenase, partial [Myxococcales bacterium]|nr:hydroxyacid dehydrogenase [Myxococcales bacterium]
SRAEVIDEAALLAGAQAGRLRAGLDVIVAEPTGKSGTFDDPLARHPGVVFTHHIGASTQEAQDAVAAEVVRILTTYDRTGRAPNCVNLETETAATHQLVVRHLDKVGVLASVLDELRKADLNVEEMENTIFAGGAAAVARIQVAADPAHVVDAVSALPHVLHVAALPLDRRAR